MADRRFPTCLFLALSLAACRERQATVERELLMPARDTVVVPWFDVTDAVPLGAGRWVVLAPQEPLVATVDAGRRTARPFGRAQARELTQPFHLFRAGDTIYVADWQRQRTTLWSLDERLVGEVPSPAGFRGALPRARDGGGRWYFELRSPPGQDGRGNLDSTSIVRVSPDFTRSDTVARLAPLDLVEVASEGRVRLERRLLSGQDRWGILPDGTVWVARVGTNQVEWRDAGGGLRRSSALPDRVLPVTESDRELFLRRFEAGLRPSVEQIPFAAIKPPFEAALGDGHGVVWLVKNRAVGDTLREYQLVDASARYARFLAHHGIGRVIGLGDGEALVAEPLESGVRLLAFVIVPAPGPAGENLR